MNKDKVKIENYLSLYQLIKYNHSINDIECEVEALKQYLEERIRLSEIKEVIRFDDSGVLEIRTLNSIYVFRKVD